MQQKASNSEAAKAEFSSPQCVALEFYMAASALCGFDNNKVNTIGFNGCLKVQGAF